MLIWKDLKKNISKFKTQTAKDWIQYNCFYIHCDIYIYICLHVYIYIDVEMEMNIDVDMNVDTYTHIDKEL